MKREFAIPVGNSYAADDEATPHSDEPAVVIQEDMPIDDGRQSDH